MDDAAPLYLDHAATTPPDARVAEAMMPWLTRPANAGARHHAFGAAADRAVRAARAQVAARIGAAADDIIFTSGATEANNLVLRGLAAHLRAAGKTHIVTGAVEHKSVLEPLASLDGFTVSILPVKPCAMIEAGMIKKALRPDTGLVTVQAVNNETGTIQPLAEIAAMLRGRGILFHTDAAQVLGKIAFDVRETGVDFASLSAHKVCGPQGIGALYIAPGRREYLEPLHHGGGQEKGLRSGTLSVALCAGFGAACEILADDRARLQGLRDAFLERLRPLVPVVHGHSDPAWNAPGILNLRFPGIDNETLVMALPGLAFGIGSACASEGNKISHVIAAIAGEQAAREAIRLSFGRTTGADELNKAADQIIAAVTDIRKLQEAA
jgi:cysteine desulfurase